MEISLIAAAPIDLAAVSMTVLEWIAEASAAGLGVFVAVFAIGKLMHGFHVAMNFRSSDSLPDYDTEDPYDGRD